MKEKKDNYIIKMTKEITEKLDIDLHKEYSIAEIQKILEEKGFNKGLIKFEPKKPKTGKEIVDTLVNLDIIICDAIYKELGDLYEND